MNFLGMNVGRHDAGLCRLKIGQNAQLDLVVYEEERFSRRKQRGGYPLTAINAAASDAPLGEIPAANCAVTNFREPPLERLLSLSQRPMFADFLKASGCSQLSPSNPSLRSITHHEAHLFSVLPLIREERALIVVSDGEGSAMAHAHDHAILSTSGSGGRLGHENTSVYLKDGAQVRCVLKLPTFLLVEGQAGTPTASDLYNWSAHTVFGGWENCGKLMGLSAFHQGPTLNSPELWNLLDGMPSNPRLSKSAFDSLNPDVFSRYAHIAASAQSCFEHYFSALFQKLRESHPAHDTLVFTGGSALNCVFNSRLAREGLFKRIIIPPYPNDEGVAIGAAIACAYLAGEYAIGHHFLPDTAFLGSPASLGGDSILRRAFEGHTLSHADDTALAKALVAGEIIGWVHGRSECGPRALGHRSLLAFPSVPGIKDILNTSYKHREAFRPYGVSVLAEDIGSYFECPAGLESPYMSYAPRVRADAREFLKEVMQPDQTVRVQTVTSREPELRRLLVELRSQTGHGVVVHTSLNVMNEPIVETLGDVKRFLATTPLRRLVVGNVLVGRQGAE